MESFQQIDSRSLHPIHVFFLGCAFPCGLQFFLPFSEEYEKEYSPAPITRRCPQFSADQGWNRIVWIYLPVTR